MRGPRTVRGDFLAFVSDLALGMLLMGAALAAYGVIDVHERSIERARDAAAEIGGAR